LAEDTKIKLVNLFITFVISKKAKNVMQPKPRKVRKIDFYELWDLIEENPDADQAELARHFGCTKISISRMINKYDIPYQSKEHKRNAHKIDIDVLKKLTQDNPDMPIKTIAKQFKCTTTAIYMALKKQNILHRPKSRSWKIDIEKLKQLIKERPNDTLEELAKSLGCTRTGVSWTIERYNIPYKSKHGRKRSRDE